MRRMAVRMYPYFFSYMLPMSSPLVSGIFTLILIVAPIWIRRAHVASRLPPKDTTSPQLVQIKFQAPGSRVSQNTAYSTHRYATQYIICHSNQILCQL